MGFARIRRLGSAARSALVALTVILLTASGLIVASAPARAASELLAQGNWNVGNMVVDKFDNVYLTDATSHKLIKITPNGVASVVADTSVTDPDRAKTWLDVDPEGNVYVADFIPWVDRGLLRKIKPSGEVAWSAKLGFGDESFTMDDQGVVYVVNHHSIPVAIRKITGPKPEDTTTFLVKAPPVVHSLGDRLTPGLRDIAFDGQGNAIVVGHDTYGAGDVMSLLRLAPDGSFTPLAEFPADATVENLRIDGQGNAYVAVSDQSPDENHYDIKKVSPDGVVTTESSARLRTVRSMEVNATGTVYVTAQGPSWRDDIIMIAPDMSNVTLGTSAASVVALGNAGEVYAAVRSNYEYTTDIYRRIQPTTVTFDANGGTGEMTAQVAAVNMALKRASLTREGYVFAGWNTKADGTGTAFADGAWYSFDADVTLYAQWGTIPAVQNVKVTVDDAVGKARVSWDLSGPIPAGWSDRVAHQVVATPNGAQTGPTCWRGYSQNEMSCGLKGLKAGAKYTITTKTFVDADVHSQTQTTFTAPPASPRQPGVSINSGQQFTNNPTVTLTLGWVEWARKMKISNDGGFTKFVTPAVAGTYQWKLDTGYSGTATKVVYVRFIGGGKEDAVYSDDIIFDNAPPVVTSAVGAPETGARSEAQPSARAAKTRNWKITTKARDNRSGVRTLQIATSKSGTGAKTLTFTTKAVKVALPKAAKTAYVRVRDGATNWSSWKQVTRK